MPDTHVVTNQVPPLADHNPATSPVLVEALIREGGQWGLDEVTELGAIAGGAQAQRWGDLADRNRPVLHTHDRYGHRIDEIEFDPAYHELMRTAIAHGLHAAPWADDRPGAHVVRAAKMYSTKESVKERNLATKNSHLCFAKYAKTDTNVHATNAFWTTK